MSTKKQRNSTSNVEEDLSDDDKIERLGTEIDQLKASLEGVPQMTKEWIRIKTNIKDKDTERILLVEKKRCDEVVEQYFEDNPHILEAVPECPICLEKMWQTLTSGTSLACCGKAMCKDCKNRFSEDIISCPLCRGAIPRSRDEIDRIIQARANEGVAWAQTMLGIEYLYGVRRKANKEEGLTILQQAAEKEDKAARAILGKYYIRVADYTKAHHWCKAALDKGELGVLPELAQLIDKGLGCKRDTEEAMRLCTVAVTLLEDPACMGRLAPCFENAPTLGLYYTLPAAEHGTGTGMELYAYLLLVVTIKYFDGDYSITGHSPVPKALFWYRRVDAKRIPEIKKKFEDLEHKIRANCAHCRAVLLKDKRSCCVECKAAYYCSKACQVAHWKAGHKMDCVKKLKKRLRLKENSARRDRAEKLRGGSGHFSTLD